MRSDADRQGAGVLALFDIDGTLIASAGAGIRALERAGREIFDREFNAAGVDYAGRLDPLIIRDLLLANGIPPSAEASAGLAEGYVRFLPDELSSGCGVTVLPGVLDLLEALRRRADVALGVLTGNLPGSGRIKLAHAGIDPAWFEVCVWGVDSPHEPPAREHLPGVGLERWAGGRFRSEPDRVVIIGDTPHDVSAALAWGCRCVAVATGRFSGAELSHAGATIVVETLQDTPRLIELVRTR